ncbi:MAG: hypothetical protein NVSMB4_09080 [Acidimicrobiales bacterium]
MNAEAGDELMVEWGFDAVWATVEEVYNKGTRMVVRIGDSTYGMPTSRVVDDGDTP